MKVFQNFLSQGMIEENHGTFILYPRQTTITLAAHVCQGLITQKSKLGTGQLPQCDKQELQKCSPVPSDVCLGTNYGL